MTRILLPADERTFERLRAAAARTGGRGLKPAQPASPGMKVEAEARMGELIIAGQEAGQIAKAGQPKRIISTDDNSPARLEAMGITPNASAQAQQLAKPADPRPKAPAPAASSAKPDRGQPARPVAQAQDDGDRLDELFFGGRG